jgi:hypothetical protein
MVKRSGRKHRAPLRQRFAFEDIPDKIGVEWDNIFPVGSPPADFKFYGLSDNAHRELWNLVRDIAWVYFLETFRAGQVASGASVNEEITRLAKAANKFADSLGSIDADTSDALVPHIQPLNDGADTPFNILRLKDLVGELRNLSEWCDAAVASRRANPQRPRQNLQQDAITALAHEWRNLGNVPTSTPRGPFCSAAEFMGDKLGFHVSGRTVRTAVKDSVNNKEG